MRDRSQAIVFDNDLWDAAHDKEVKEKMGGDHSHCLAHFIAGDCNGVITLDSLVSAFEKLGITKSKPIMERLFYVMDAKREGQIKEEQLDQFLHQLSLAIGMLRLDYYYDENAGDAAHASSHIMRMVEKHVDGMTFEKCQYGVWNEEIEENTKKAIKFFEEENCAFITGDCGFMANYDSKIREMTNIPVCMSSLTYIQELHRMTAHGVVGILTANSESLNAGMDQVLKSMYGEGYDKSLMDNFVVVGLQDVPDFGYEVAKGLKVSTLKAERNILELLDDLNKKHKFSGFLMECTELPQFADAIRFRFSVPVFDCVTMAHRFCATRLPNKNFGLFAELQEFITKYNAHQHKADRCVLKDLLQVANHQEVRQVYPFGHHEDENYYDIIGHGHSHDIGHSH